MVMYNTFPSPNLGLSLKWVIAVQNEPQFILFPSPNLGLSLKYESEVLKHE